MADSYTVAQVERIIAVAENLMDECETFLEQKLSDELAEKFIETIKAYASDLEKTSEDT